MNEHEHKKGLVLGGGGARGCYEIGAWQAFRELNIHFDCVSGTSIGAIVGAMYVQGALEPMVDFVYHLKPTDVAADLFEFPENFQEAFENRKVMMDYLSKYMISKADITPLKAAMQQMFDYEAFHNSPVNYACMTFNVSRLSGRAFFKDEMTPENALDIILASASCFPAFPMLEMEGENYIDGGYENNLPWNLALEMGAHSLVMIDVHGPGRVQKMEENVDTLLIQPLLPLGNFLDFSTDMALRSLHMGYLETMKYYGACCGYLYTFPANNWPAIFVFEQFTEMQLKKEKLHMNRFIANKVISYILPYKPVPLHNRYQNDYAIGLVVEALAYLFNIEAVQLYDYKDFLARLSKHLVQSEPLYQNLHQKDLLQVLQTSKKEEAVLLIHQVIAENHGHLPFYLSRIKTLMDCEYYLAIIWFCLDLYLKKA
jgi:predicted acylesterase/phospholipase RssA